MSIRMPREMHEQIQELAKRGDRSVSAQVIRLLRQALQDPR
ncbi:MAG: Arc family DNA-binding protein [Pseudomonadales bacterium]